MAAYGAFAPSAAQKALIGFGHAMPRNWLGQRGATAARYLVQRLWPRPVDGERLGSRMRLNPIGNASERRLLISPQFFDPEVLALLATRIRPGMIFIDVGANAGTYSLFVAGRAGPDARILAVEPNPGARERLACNVALNGYRTVEVIGAAIGASEGEADLLVNDRNMGTSSVRRHWDGMPGTQLIRVPCLTLAGLAAAKGLARIDAIKVDVEGSEDEVLAPLLEGGAPGLWPGLIIVEENRASWRTDVLALAAARGYRQILNSGGNVVLERAGN